MGSQFGQTPPSGLPQGIPAGQMMMVGNPNSSISNQQELSQFGIPFNLGSNGQSIPVGQGIQAMGVPQRINVSNIDNK